MHFSEQADTDIKAIDQYGSQTTVDPSTGKTIGGKASNELE
jgi:hypothetical protein